MNPKVTACSPGGQYYHPEDIAERASITDEEAQYVRAMSWGKDCLDIGTGVGISALAMHGSARSVTTVDPDPWVEDQIQLPVEIRRLRSIPGGSFGFALIDGDHAYESVKSDWDSISGRCSMVAFHDNTTSHPGVIRLMSEIREDGYDMFTFGTLGRLTIVVNP